MYKKEERDREREREEEGFLTAWYDITINYSNLRKIALFVKGPYE